MLLLLVLLFALLVADDCELVDEADWEEEEKGDELLEAGVYRCDGELLVKADVCSFCCILGDDLVS